MDAWSYITNRKYQLKETLISRRALKWFYFSDELNSAFAKMKKKLVH